jgi:hypothetical protein
MAVPLFTSIPPAMVRTNDAGDEIGRQYQQDCLISWEEAGFTTTTINARAERLDLDVRRITIDRDASEITGRPHPYFGDLLSAVAADIDGPFALANADIAIPAESRLAETTHSLKPGQVIFSRRVDVGPDGKIGAYRHGFDFFAVHTSDLSRDLLESSLVFGAPWWDHYLPLALHMLGHRVTQIVPEVTHMEHDERWSWAVWSCLGRRFIDEIRPVATATYRARLRLICPRGTPAQSETKGRATLGRVSDLNLAVLDRLSA